MSTLRIAQVGLRGFGRIHTERIERLRSLGRVELVAAADPAGPTDLDCPWFSSLTELLASVEVDIVSIATPIGTHLPLAREAMDAGAHVFLEKPPVASLEEFWALLRHAKETGRVVQVGFQSLGSAGVPRLRSLLADGSFGRGATVGARGVWVRDRAYYGRARWAGRRVLDGRRVADGVVTNPLAHAVATALVVAGVDALDDIEAVETELYHAHAIEADDTSFVRIRTAGGPPVCAGLTLCGPDQVPPTIEVRGPSGSASYSYTEDVLELELDGHRTTEHFERACLLENLVDHLDRGAGLMVPLASTVGFMSVLEATQARPDPLPLMRGVTWVGQDEEAHPVVDRVGEWIDEALRRGEGFAAVGAPWASPDARHVWRPRTMLDRLVVADRVVAEYADGSDIMPSSSPRPYLHPLRTLGGVRVSDAHPADHDWHCGLSLTLQDVNGVNFWGGRTYVRDEGYRWRGDQGEIRHDVWLERGPDRLSQRLRWVGPTIAEANPGIAPVEVRETRSLNWARLDEDAWRLDGTFSLEAVTPAEIRLGGPGTNGRADAGYGGWQLRLRRSRTLRIWGSDAEGVDAVYGRAAPWVAYAAEIDQAPVTVIMAHLDAAAAASDRWFVRTDEFQGLGTALAWEREVPLPLSRRYRLVVVDGVPEDARLARWLPDLG